MQNETNPDVRYNNNIFHDIDHRKCRNQLNKFYGVVANAQNNHIHKLLKGKKILDVGSGYGTLTEFLLNLGYDVIGIEPNVEKRKCAKEWYGIELLSEDIYKTNFNNNEFDCVILREVVFHLDFHEAVKEIDRICKNQIIIFQGNSILFRKIGQAIYKHKEYNEKKYHYYIEILKKAGYSIENLIFRDPLAFPLSGGFIGKQMIADSKFLYNSILWFDEILNSMFKIIKLQKFLCSRYIISAVKVTSK